jgi:hypothetical protein
VCWANIPFCTINQAGKKLTPKGLFNILCTINCLEWMSSIFVLGLYRESVLDTWPRPPFMVVGERGTLVKLCPLASLGGIWRWERMCRDPWWTSPTMTPPNGHHVWPCVFLLYSYLTLYFISFLYLWCI